MAASGVPTESSVRKRRVDSRRTETDSVPSHSEHGANASGGSEKEKELLSLQPGTYWLTRIVLLRSVAFIYCESGNCYVHVESCCSCTDLR